VHGAIDLIDWLVFAPFLVAMALTLWWYRTGPSLRTKSQISSALEPKGLQLISVKPKLEFRLGKSSRALLIAKARNPYGNIQTIYFEVDVWADLFSSRPNVRELGGYLGNRFLPLGDF